MLREERLRRRRWAKNAFCVPVARLLAGALAYGPRPKTRSVPRLCELVADDNQAFMPEEVGELYDEIFDGETLNERRDIANDIRGLVAGINRASEIRPGLWMGSGYVASRPSVLRDLGIRAVVNCAGVLLPNFAPEHFDYLKLDLHDSSRQDITAALDTATTFIDKYGGCNVFVHCQKGISRSAAVVIGYLMRSASLTFEDALEHVQAARPIVNPNAGFRKQLATGEAPAHEDDGDRDTAIWRIDSDLAFGPRRVA